MHITKFSRARVIVSEINELTKAIEDWKRLIDSDINRAVGIWHKDSSSMVWVNCIGWNEICNRQIELMKERIKYLNRAFDKL